MRHTAVCALSSAPSCAGEPIAPARTPGASSQRHGERAHHSGGRRLRCRGGHRSSGARDVRGDGQHQRDVQRKGDHGGSSAGADFTIDCANVGRGFVLTSGEGTASVLRGVRIVSGEHAVFGGAVYCVLVAECRIPSSSATVPDSAAERYTAIRRRRSSRATRSKVRRTGARSGAREAPRFSLRRTNSSRMQRAFPVERWPAGRRRRRSRTTGSWKTWRRGRRRNILSDRDQSSDGTEHLRGQHRAGERRRHRTPADHGDDPEQSLQRQHLALGGSVCSTTSPQAPSETTRSTKTARGRAPRYTARTTRRLPISNNIVVNSPSGNPIDSKNDSAPVVTCCCLLDSTTTPPATRSSNPQPQLQ